MSCEPRCCASQDISTRLKRLFPSQLTTKSAFEWRVAEYAVQTCRSGKGENGSVIRPNPVHLGMKPGALWIALARECETYAKAIASRSFRITGLLSMTSP